MRRILRWGLSALLPTMLMAQAPAAPAPPVSIQNARRNFVSCPIMRDTKTLPCWLAEYNGETYFLGSGGSVSDDFHPPQLEHEVLVEGTVAPGPRICGGIPLRPVKLSVLGELAPACRTMLPAQDGIEAPAQARRTPESWVTRDGENGLTLYFEFDDDFLSVPGSIAMNTFVSDFKKKGAARMEVTASRGSTLLSNGKVLNERAGVPQERLGKIVAVLKGLGVSEAAITARASDTLSKPDGVNDQRSRRVVLAVRR